MEELEKVLEELHDRNINVLDLDVANSIKWEISYHEKEFTKEEKQKIFDIVDYAYLKSENTQLDNITHVVVMNFDNIDDMDVWDIIEEAC